MEKRKARALMMLCVFAVIIVISSLLLHNMNKVPTEVQPERVAESFIDCVKTNNKSIFDEITSDKIVKNYNNGTRKSKSEVLISIKRQLEIDFGSEITMKVRNAQTDITKTPFSTTLSVLFIGEAKGTKDTGLFGFSLIMSDDLISNIIYYTKDEVAEIAENRNLTTEPPTETTTEEMLTYDAAKYLWEY